MLRNKKLNSLIFITTIWLTIFLQSSWAGIAEQTTLIESPAAFMSQLQQGVTSEPAVKALNAQERAWIRQHPVVRAGNMLNWLPIDFRKDDIASGFSVEYLKLVAGKVGIELQFIPGSWDVLLEKAFNKELDVMPHLVKSEVRSKKLLYSKPYAGSPTAIFSRRDDLHQNNIHDLRGKKVAIVKDFYTHRYLRENHPEIELLPTVSTLESIMAVSTGRADAMLDHLAVGNYVIASNFIVNVTPSGATGIDALDKANWSVGVRNDWPELMAILQKGMSQVTWEEFSVLVKRWYLYSASAERPALQLTDKEQVWLSKHSQVWLAYDGYYPPYSFIGSNGEYQGYAVDVVARLARITGIEFRTHPKNTWKDLYAAAKERELDVVATMVQSRQREGRFSFTHPYIFKSTYIFADDNSDIKTPVDLAGKRVAMVSGYIQNKVLLQNHPGIKVVYFETVHEALRAIEAGTVDAYVDALSICNYVIKQQGIKSVVPIVPYAFEQYNESFGIRKDWPELRSILNKAIQIIPKQELNELRKKWGLVEYKAIEFSAKEKAWLEANPVIRVSNELDWPPYDFNVSGKPMGYVIDYMKLLAEKLGLKLEFVTAPWPELLEKFKQGDIDLIHPLLYSEERAGFMNFTDPILGQSSTMVVRKEDADESSLESLYGKTLASVDSWVMTEYIREQHPKIKIYPVNNALEGLRAVQFGQADAWIDAYGACRYLMDSNFMSNLKISGELTDSEHLRYVEYRVGVKKGWLMLHDLLNKAISSVSVDDLRALNNKWRVYSDQARILHLTREEQQWLSNHSVIRTATDRSWAPIEWVDEEGVFQGISADYLKRIETLLGVHFEVATQLNWQQSLAAFKRGELDIITSVRRTAARETFMNFTDTYANFPIVVFAATKFPYIRSIDELDGRRVGVVEGYGTYDLLVSKHQSIELMTVANTLEGLEKLSDGEIDAYVGSLLVASHYISESGYSNIKVAGDTPYSFDQSMGVQKASPVLLSILNKALNSISASEKNDIYKRWVNLRYEHAFNYTLLWQVIVAACLLLLLALVWGLNMRKQKLALAEARKEAERLAVTDQLTGIFNRRHLDEILVNEIDRAERYDDGFAVIMADIDDFKQVNDTHGHQVGDEVLKTVTSVLQKRLRRSDTLGRWGGDEFLMICPNVDCDNLIEITEYLRVSIEKEDFIRVGQKTASFGIYIYQKGDRPEDIIKLVDNALYQAKESGRNRAVCYAVDALL
ncbi:MAG: transporter substrate-binding domain-containing protein [Sedimenticola sp.]